MGPQDSGQLETAPNLRPDLGRGMDKAALVFVRSSVGIAHDSWLPRLPDTAGWSPAPQSRLPWGPREVNCTHFRFAGCTPCPRSHSLGLVGTCSSPGNVSMAQGLGTRLRVSDLAGEQRSGASVAKCPGPDQQQGPQLNLLISLPASLFPVLFNYRQHQCLCQ